jgi:hypothetical protein
MATVTKPPQTNWNRDETQRRVRHPLERLRGYIRFYVTAEGLAVLLLYLLLWFWIGLALDYGLFKLFNSDIVQELPHGFRVGVLVVLAAGLLAVVALSVLLRLFRQFRHAALALVLERRFPQLLGDRLITAVELADPKVGERYGYSQAMIDQTIRDAADKVDQAPVGQVFNWRRLWRYGAVVVALALGCYLLVGVGYGAYHYFNDDQSPSAGDYVADFNETAGIWFERNILLSDTIWPRRAYLELLDFPEEKKIGRGSPSPTVRVRALKWVVADADRKRAPEGWRALRWSDLTPDLLGMPLPKLPAGKGWEPRDEAYGITVDEVELKLQKPEIKQTTKADDVIALDHVLDRLKELSAQRSMHRRLRQLKVPPQVFVKLKGATTSTQESLSVQADNEYSGQLSELKESVRFRVQGEDYFTPWRKITVVPPPDLAELAIDEDQPAYLYHRIPYDGSVTDLKGQKQQFRHRLISLTGEKSSVEVPAGTDVVLTAKATKELRQPGGVEFDTSKRLGVPPGPITQTDANTFETRFTNVTTPIDLVFRFTDTDGVVGTREVVIRPVPDLPPDVNVTVEVLRKTNQGYLCTPTARIPFSGSVHDDHGLSNVEFVYTQVRVQSDAARQLEITRRAFGGVAPGAGLNGLVSLAFLHSVGKAADDEAKLPEHREPLAKFLAESRSQQVLSVIDLRARLRALADNAPPEEQRLREAYFAPEQVGRRLMTEFNCEPEAESKTGTYFDVAKLGLKVRGENVFQPRYRLRLTMIATDNNIDTGPRSSQNKEKFTIIVVSEEELLAEIGKEEENLHYKLKETIDRLKDARGKLEGVMRELPGLKPDEFAPMVRRAEEVQETLGKGKDIVHEVQLAYTGILQELKVNRDREVPSGLVNKMIEKVEEKIVQPLNTSLESDFPEADSSVSGLGKSLDDKSKDAAPGKKAQQDLDRVIQRLEAVLDNMGEIMGINKLIAALVKIKEGEEKAQDELKILHRQKFDDLMRRLNQPKPK